MARIYVALTEEEMDVLDELKVEWERKFGCSISRQKFARTLISRQLIEKIQSREI